MSKPFQIILSFNAPISEKPGSVMLVDIETEGLDPATDRNHTLIMGLSHVLVAYSKSVAGALPEPTKRAFLDFMQAVWEDGPTPLPVGLTSREVAEA